MGAADNARAEYRLGKPVIMTVFTVTNGVRNRE
jgi:hypothetical protein